MIIKVDRFENPLFENVLIWDMYIKVKTGGSRTLDRVYSQSKLYYKYLRYGLTFLEYYDKEDPELCTKVELVRKGLMRVFELKADYLVQDPDLMMSQGKIMSQKDSNIRKFIIGEALDTLQIGCLNFSNLTLDSSQSSQKLLYGVEICHYVQTDGINVQVSYSKELQSWSIGSYNVSIMVSKRSDLEQYPGYNKTINEMEKHEIRYNYWHIIANAWFDLLDQLYVKHTDLDLDSEFYEIMSRCTLVGEYVGVDPTSQVLHYKNKSLIFSAMIDKNNATETCMLPEKFVDFCNDWGLDYISIRREAWAENIEELKDSMLDLYREVTSGSLYDSEEGSIMMLISRSSDPKEDKVLSCSKIKTIEYKIFK